MRGFIVHFQGLCLVTGLVAPERSVLRTQASQNATERNRTQASQNAAFRDPKTASRAPENTPDAPSGKRSKMQNFFRAGGFGGAAAPPIPSRVRPRAPEAREAPFPGCTMPRTQPERSQNAGTWNACSTATKPPRGSKRPRGIINQQFQPRRRFVSVRLWPKTAPRILHVQCTLSSS